jgi:hypothetical protein
MMIGSFQADMHKATHADPFPAAAQGDVISLKTDVSKCIGPISTAADTAMSNVAQLVELERVKTRMEAACSVLKVCRIANVPCGCHRWLTLLSYLYPAAL